MSVTLSKIPQTSPTHFKIAIHPDAPVASIRNEIYSGFTEHMGRCIYSGIFDPGNPLSDARGFRLDVLEALKELDISVVRYPGGNFVATYNWEDGVGPVEKRPKRYDLAWLTTEPNTFGTNEFMLWCRALGAQPYLALNFGTGTLASALAWLEYCNGTGDTHYANLRRAHGFPEPWRVKYWALGNEMWGPWQVGQMTKEAYAEKAWQWGKALKLVDPSITLILCGETGVSDWDRYVLQRCMRWEGHALGGDSTKGLIDMHSIHLYTASPNHLENVTGPLAAERAIEVTAALIDLARITNNVPSSVPKPTICFDEWNVWDPVRAPGPSGAEESYTLSDALAVAVWLNVFIRQSAHLGMANIAQSVNVISPLMTDSHGITKQTTWWPLLLFSRWMRGESVAVAVRCGVYEGGTAPGWLQGVKEAAWLDVSAARKGKVVTLAVVNIKEDEDVEVELDGVVSGEVTVIRFGGKKGEGVWTKEVNLTEDKIQWAGGSFVFRQASLTMLRWQEFV